MKTKSTLSSSRDSVEEKILAEYFILRQNFESPEVFAKFIVEQVKREVARNLLVGQSESQKNSSDLMYSQFLLSRARATGVRSLIQEQNWYLATLTELKNLQKGDIQ